MGMVVVDKTVISPILAGRAAELTTLANWVEQTRNGTGKVVLLSGEAGIGKSRLVVEIKRMLGGHCLEGRCYEQDRALPYAPLIDLLRVQASQVFRNLRNHSPLTRLLPELGDAPVPGEPEQDKRRLFEALAEALTASPHPAHEVRGIIIEDLHWYDDATLEFLQFFARRIGSRPVLLVMTYRSDEVGSSLERFLAALDRERLANEIALQRLNLQDTASMIRAVFDLPHTPQAEFLTTIHQLTDGNPFFVEEVLKSFVASGEIFELGGQWSRKPLGQLRVPRTVQAAVRQRTEQLSADVQQLLNIAAVAGQRWDFAVLQHLTGHDEATLTAHIKALIAAQLVVEESADAFAFRHALTRQAIYTSLLTRERTALHGAIGQTLEQLHPQHLNPEALETSETASTTATSISASLAYHFYEAGMWEKTARYAHRAAEHAQMLGAPRAALEQWTRAIDATKALPRQSKESWIGALYRARGQAHETLGQFDAARDDFLHALEEARTKLDDRMEWRCLLDLGFLWTSRDFQIVRGYFDRALELARALEDPVALAHTLNRIGNWHVNCEQPAEGERLHREALTLFEKLQDPLGIAATLDLLGGALFLGGNLPAGMAHYTQAAARFRVLNDRRGLSSSLVWLTHRGSVLNTMLVAVDSAANCIRAGEEAIDLAREIDWRSGESFAKVVLGMCCATQGDYGRALVLLHDGIHIAQEINHAQGLIVGLFGLGATHLDLLALDKAQQTLEQGLALTRPVNILFGDRLYSALLGLTYIAQGELTKASSVLDAVIGAAPAEMPTQPTLAQRLCWLSRATLWLAAGNPSATLVIVDRLIGLVKRTASSESSDVWVEPRLLKLRGDAQVALGQTDTAEATLQEALRAAAHQGARPLVWRIHIALGKLSQSQAQHAKAETHFATARETLAALADTLAAEPLREAFLDSALAYIPASPTLTPLRAAKLEHAGLTEREREVAALIAHGLSNREIAERLSISQRTAGAHVGNILAKLGFASRAQVAAWATEKGLH